MSQKFCEQDDIQLVKMVKSSPCLYQSNSKLKNPEDCRQAWEHISKTLGKPELDCKTRWKSMRDYYIRRKKDAQHFEVSESFEKKKYYNLTFLDNHLPKSRMIKTKKNKETVKNENLFQFVPVDMQEQMDIIDIKQESDSISDQIECVVESSSEAPLQDEEEIPNNEDIATSMFFQSIAVTVMNLPPELKAQAKLKVLEIVTQFEIRAIKSTETQKIELNTLESTQY